MFEKVEKKWIKVLNISSEQNISFTKQKVFFLKDIDICYFIGEIDFINLLETEEIVIDLPEITHNFVPCENTIFVTKTPKDLESPQKEQEAVNSIVRIKLYPKKLVFTAFPFEKDFEYEFNIQLFMRVKS
jgi:hypothetical protein